MKKRVSGCLAVLMALLPNTVLAAEEIPLRQTIFGTERVVAYWVLGICSAAFLTLVCIWSVKLKHGQPNANQTTVRAAHARIHK